MKYKENELKQGIKIHTINTNKFKTNLLAVFLTTELNRKTVTKNALISMLLRRGSKNMSTQEEISKQMEEMYGASFDCGLDKTGDNQVLKFYIEVINDDFLPQNNDEMLKKAIQKLLEIVFDPYTEGEGFKKEYIEQEKENLKQELKIDDKSVVCTYVAELNKNKNQQLLIKAIKRLKDDNNNVTLLLVGKGKYEQKLLKLIKKLNLEENVKLLGYRSDIVKILSITDIYLASSLREGLPVNVMEAMYMGLPIIAVDNRGHRELVQHNENGFIVEQNSAMENNMSSYLKLLVNDKNLRYQFGKDSKEKVREYTLNNVINSMNKIYF